MEKEKYFRIPIDTYTLALDGIKKPKYIGAFKEFLVGGFSETVAYVKAIVLDKYYEKLVNKEDVSELSQEDYNLAIKRLLK